MDDEREKANKVIWILYGLMVVGMALPVIVFFLLR